jgi:hypothetical protein
MIMTQAVYRLNGTYFGFIWQARLFDKNRNYIGWVDGTEVWTTNNDYLGELVDGKYIVRSSKIETHPSCKGQCPPPVKPVEPAKCENAKAISRRSLRKDYIDALDDF